MNIRAQVDFGGTARAGQTVSVFNHGTQTLATITDQAGTPVPNPTTVAGNGHVFFYAVPGSYDVVGPDLTRTVDLSAPPSPSGSLALMPATGTGSKAFYWATDDNGGTLYQDLTNGSPYTKVTMGLAQTGGRELARASYTGASMTMTAQADVTGVSITFTVGARPVDVEAFVPLAANNTAAKQVMGQITDNANAERARNIDMSVAANDACSVRCVERISTPGTYTRKLRLGNNGGGGTVTVYGTGTSVAMEPYIKATER